MSARIDESGQTRPGGAAITRDALPYVAWRDPNATGTRPRPPTFGPGGSVRG